MPNTVNPQITDSVTQVNTKVLGDAPAIAMGNLFIATSQALANAAHNATANQQQTNITAQAATTMAVSTMLSLDTAATAHAASGTPTAAMVASPVEASPAQKLSDAAYRAAIESTDPMLSLMVLDAGALAIFDAVSHLQRTAIITEAATGMALTRALASPDQAVWKEVLQGAEDCLAHATAHLEKIGHLAIALHREARG